MITRRCILLAVCCLAAVSAQYHPVSSAGEDNDCALYLSGPGRSSAFDYNLNLLRGSFPYDGQHTCITYDAVNAAYIEARKRINVATPKGDWKTEDIASVGELMLDISISLARTYGLTYEDIEKGLPLIDTSKTLIREVCPPFLANVECRAGKYRRFDGLCTNLEHPTWGATMTPFQRLIAPLYADGINAPRVSVTGHDLPLSRIVSRTMHPDDGFHDHAGTVMVIAWGQFMDHDYTLTGTPLDPFNRNDPEECCNRPPHQKHPYCNELRIPDDDYFYRLFNIKCIDFVRGFPSPRAGCRLGSRQQFNTLTGVLDGNTVYGVTEKFSRKLRSGVGGLLRMNPVFEEYGLKDLLPLKLDIPDEGCTRPNRSMYCFEAGEIRVNEQLVLTCMHTLMAREHNRIARGLAQVNPHWDDEVLFQESRRIVVAEIQHVTYNEFLPILLGKEVMDKFGLLLQKEDYWDGYDTNVNPSVIDAFSAAAFRFGHSLLPTAVERWSKAHKFIASKRLSDLIRRPYDLYRAGVFDEYLMGLMNQVAQAMDDSITQEVTNHLFKKPGARFGMDLVSFNMQRGREFGLPGYMEFRKFCGLPGANSFQELFGSMPNETIQRYESIFEHPSDVDLWSGGVSERPLPGSMLGPTFACIIATQFSYSRRGDRFWYELPNQPSSFTPEQLAELRKSRLSRLICDNTDIIDTVQVYPMVLPDHEINPRVPCRSGILPSIDFTKWADYNGQHSAPGNPYVYETQVHFVNTSIGSTTISPINENKTQSFEGNNNLQNNSSTEKPLQKNGGHYKNALRRRKRNAPIYSNKNHNYTADLLSAPVLVSQVIEDFYKNNRFRPIETTATPILPDLRADTSPQTFAPHTVETVLNNWDYILNKNNIDPFHYNREKKRKENLNLNQAKQDKNKNINNDKKVSIQKPKEKLPRSDKESTYYNDEKFIPDEDQQERTFHNEPSKKEVTLPETRGLNKHKHKKNTDYQGFSREDIVGRKQPSGEQSKIPNKSTDESFDLNERSNKRCSGDSRTKYYVDSPQPNEKLFESDCDSNSESVERISNENVSVEDTSTEVPLIHKPISKKQNIPNALEEPAENAKEQFERIPLNYKHDDKGIKIANLEENENEKDEEEDGEDDDEEEEVEEKEKEEDEEEEEEEKEEEEGAGEGEVDRSEEEVDEVVEKEAGNESEEIKDEKKDDQEEKYPGSHLKIDLGDTTVELDDIKLPESVFGLYDSPFFQKLQKERKDKNESDLKDHEDDEDPETNDDASDHYTYDDKETTDSTDTPDISKSRKPKEDEEDDDEEDDYYANFKPPYIPFDTKVAKLKEEFGQPSTLDLEKYIEDPTLKSAVGKISEKIRKNEEDANDDNYYWTLEYGQPN